MVDRALGGRNHERPGRQRGPGAALRAPATRRRAGRDRSDRRPRRCRSRSAGPGSSGCIATHRRATRRTRALPISGPGLYCAPAPDTLKTTGSRSASQTRHGPDPSPYRVVEDAMPAEGTNIQKELNPLANAERQFDEAAARLNLPEGIKRGHQAPAPRDDRVAAGPDGRRHASGSSPATACSTRSCAARPRAASATTPTSRSTRSRRWPRG